MGASDWDVTIEGLSAAAPAPRVEHTLWTLRRGTRVAEARVRPHPLGQELRFIVDGELLWSEVFGPRRGIVLGEISDSKRAEFQALGWS